MLKRYFLLSLAIVIGYVTVYAQNIPPKITTDSTLCKGSSLALNDLIKSYGSVRPNDMVWYPYGSNSGLGSNPTVKPTVQTRYVLRYVYPNQSSGSPIYVTINVVDPPTIQAMDNVEICEGQDLQLTLKSQENVDDIWWEWLGKGVTYENNTIVRPGDPAEKENHTVVYRVYGRNNICGQIVQQDVTVSVKVPLSLGSIKVVSNYSFCIGETVDLSNLLYFSVNNIKGKQYFFHQTDNEVSNYQINWQGISNPTAYKVTGNVTLQAYVRAQIVVPNDCGSASKNFTNEQVPINLKVEGTKPSLTSISEGSTHNYYPYIVCKGDSVVISALSGTCGIIDTVEWISPSIGYANRVGATADEWKYYWKPTASTTFQARIKTKSKSNGSIETELATITINVKNYPQLVAIKDTSACDNLSQTIDLNGLLNPNSYIGLPDWLGINPVLVNPKESKTYQVKATSGYTCQNMTNNIIEGSINVNVKTLMPITVMPDVTICKGSQVTLTAQSSGSIFWSKTIDGATIATTQTPTETTKYYVNGRNTCGLSVDSVTISVKLPPALQLRSDTTVCVNNPVLLYSTVFNGDSILWNINGKWVNSLTTTVYPTQTTTYTVKAFENGCETMGSVVVTAKPIPSLKAMNDFTICSGTLIQLEAQSDATIIWNVDNPNVNIVTDTVFYVSASNGVCTAYDTVNVKVATPPTVVAMNDRHVCYGEMISLTAEATSGQISWNVPITTFKATKSGRYVVTASNGFCVDVTDTVDISVGDSLYINPERLPRYKRNIQYNMQLQTNALSPYNFTQIEGNLPNGFLLTASGLLNGVSSGEGLLERATFTVEVTDGDGCKVSREYLMEGEVYISDVFTPNGDGYNDYFMQGCHVIIFNRLGVNLFEGNDGWDGTHQGKVLPPDTYFYTVTYINEEGNAEKKSGSISIVKR